MIGMKRPKNRVAAKGNFILEIYIHLQCMYISKIKRREFMNENYAIEIHDLYKNFNGREAICKWNLKLERNAIHCVLGKNGAGKTTFFKLLIGLVKPTAGTITVLGYDSVKDRLKILEETGNIIEKPIFYENLSAIENLEIHLEYIGIHVQDIQSILKMVGLENVEKQPVGTFSMGMKQRLAIARALIGNPNLLILDEPLNAMDPLGIKEMRELFCKLVKNGITIIFSSHILSEVEQVADHIIFIDNGKILDEKSINEIKSLYPQGLEEYFINMSNGVLE